MRLKVGHDIAERVDIVASAIAHLLLRGLQEVDDGSVGSELGIDRERLDKHAHRVGKLLVATSVVNGGEERLLLVVEFSKQIGICRREKRALVDGMLATERMDGVDADAERAKEGGLSGGGSYRWGADVGNELSECVAAVEGFCIPRLCLLKSGRLTERLFLDSHFGQGYLLGSGSDSMISLVDIGEQQMHGSTVDDDMVIVDEEIERPVLALTCRKAAQQADAEQSVAIDVEWLDQRRYHRLNILDVFHMKRPRRDGIGVNGLEGFSLIIEHDACEERGMRLHRCFDSIAQPIDVEAIV